MKRLLLIALVAILLSVIGNCQWYNRRYGESDINQLSQEQLNEALIRAKDGMSSGAVISIISGIGIVSGISIAAASNAPEKVNRAYGGVFLAIGSVPLGLAGATTWAINGTRAKSIKEVLKSTEVKLGLVNYQRSIICSGSQGALLPCLSVTIRF